MSELRTQNLPALVVNQLEVETLVTDKVIVKLEYHLVIICELVELLKLTKN